ncbi:MAG: AAA family ATPase [Desulfuromonadaceae bacterium]|nr:AAA family ATPase [Desulfuromonadaceae bacterium]MDD5104494.1 AAA family ATPase [Desulfuromonadaceae bacterium]
MKVIALYNIKGGVGKTAACVNLAYSCAASGMRTLLWDLDSQGASSYYFNIKPEVKGGAKKLFKTRETSALVKETDIENLDLLPADTSYRHMDLFLDSEKKSKKRMSEFLGRFEDDYDVLFLDCPPSFSLVSENVFNSADVMLVPLIPTTLSLRTYDQIIEYVSDHKKLTLKVMPFFSMIDKRKKLHVDTMADEENRITGVLKTGIPYLSIIENMGVHRAPVGLFAAKSQAAILFDQLWTEIVLRAKLHSR